MSCFPWLSLGCCFCSLHCCSAPRTHPARSRAPGRRAHFGDRSLPATSSTDSRPRTFGSTTTTFPSKSTKTAISCPFLSPSPFKPISKGTPSTAFANLARCSERWWWAWEARPRFSASDFRQGKLASAAGFHARSGTADPGAAPHRVFARPESRHRRHARCHAPARPAARRTPPHSAADLNAHRSRQPKHFARRAGRRGSQQHVGLLAERRSRLGRGRSRAGFDALHRRPAIRAAERACARTRHHSDWRRNPRPVSVELHAREHARDRIPSHPRGFQTRRRRGSIASRLVVN